MTINEHNEQSTNADIAIGSLLNPSDNHGARFCLAAVEAGKAWEP